MATVQSAEVLGGTVTLELELCLHQTVVLSMKAMVNHRAKAESFFESI